MEQKKSVERKRGNRLGLWIFRTVVQVVGLRGAYGLLYFVSLYYLAMDRTAVSASLAYVKRRFPGHGALRRAFDVYLLFVSQGKNLIDRYAVASGYDGIDVQIIGYDRVLDRCKERDKGFVLMTAHVGNWQVALPALQRFGRTVYLMMRPEDNAAVRDALRIDAEQDRVKFLFTNDSLASVIEAMKAVNRGDIVSIMGDRTYGSSACEVSFLDGVVRFPYGVFSIASAAQCPVVVLLSARLGMNRYVIDVSHIIDAPTGARGKKQEAMKTAVQEFASMLEEYVADYPYQWFVFRDIWKSNE